MSAIWGMIHLDRKEASYNIGVQMEDAMMRYKLDRCLTIKKSNAVFGCGIQYITKEAVDEILPYYDEERRLFYTADCMLDNRNELMEKLQLTEDAIPDGALLYQAFLAWEDRFIDHVLGVFAFAIYDNEKNICKLYTDHTGSRSLYYCLVDRTIYFATVFAPLLAVLSKEYRQISEKWMSACELTVSPIMEFFPGLTPFESIKQVLAGHFVEFMIKDSKSVINKTCYWKLRKVKELKLKTQEEYRDLFIRTLYECIRSLLRSVDKTGITLSSGLDSSSVACIAAQLLGEAKLYSFTSVPLTDATEVQNPYFITNESDGVRRICEAYSNIVPEFVSCEGKNACSELKRMVHYLEFPHKSRQNMVWLDEIYERASLKGCKLVLKGQYGNATISRGKILSRVYDDIKHLRLITAYRQINLFCRRNKIPRKQALKLFIVEMKKKLVYSYRKFEETCVRKELLKRYDIIRVVNQYGRAGGSGIMQTKGQMLDFMYDMSAFIQLGALDTRYGLYHNIIVRDPLKDKRMIELCAAYPIKCFAQDGVERAGVRSYMRGIVPDAILDITNRRGLQGADYISRLRMDWEGTKKVMLEMLKQPSLLNYIEDAMLTQIKEDIMNDTIISMEDQLMKALMLCSCSVFLDCFDEGILHYC